MKREDITNVLKSHQVDELNNMVNEPSDLDTVDEDEYEMATAKWRLK